MKLITTYISRRSRLGGESSRQGPWQACLLYVSPCFLRTPSSPHLYTGLEGAPTLLSTRTGGCHVRAVLVWKIIRFCIVCFWPELGMFFSRNNERSITWTIIPKSIAKLIQCGIARSSILYDPLLTLQPRSHDPMAFPGEHLQGKSPGNEVGFTGTLRDLLCDTSETSQRDIQIKRTSRNTDKK